MSSLTQPLFVPCAVCLRVRAQRSIKAAQLVFVLLVCLDVETGATGEIQFALCLSPGCFVLPVENVPAYSASTLPHGLH